MESHNVLLGDMQLGWAVALTGALKSSSGGILGGEGPRTAHDSHTSHTLIIWRSCQKSRF